jgi:hypothetical protein
MNGQARDWNETKRLSKHIWKESLKPNTASKVEAIKQSYGLKDTMLQPFIDHVRSVQRQHGQYEANKIAMEYERRFGDRMFNPFFKLEGMHHLFVEFLRVLWGGLL